MNVVLHIMILFQYVRNAEGNKYVQAEISSTIIENIEIHKSKFNILSSPTASPMSALSEITTFAGIGTSGHAGDGGPANAANIAGPLGIFGDTLGNVYFTESANYIRKVDTNSLITTVAGTGSATTSGTVDSEDGRRATSCTFNAPQQIQFYIDANGCSLQIRATIESAACQ